MSIDVPDEISGPRADRFSFRYTLSRDGIRRWPRFSDVCRTALSGILRKKERAVSESPFKYRAFLSYSHHDKTICAWLHRALETYPVDRDLVGRPTAWGPVPKSLRPIFRDRDDFSASASLSEETLAAIKGSEFLIVACSPNSAASIYVNKEVRTFKTLGRSARVIPVIVGGDLELDTSKLFPSALRFIVDGSGTITNVPNEPLAADLRDQRDGKRGGLLKVVAGLLGIGLDEIVRRDVRARKKRFWIRTGLSSGVVLLCLALLLTYRMSEDRLDLGIKSASRLAYVADHFSQKEGFSVEEMRALSSDAETKLTALISSGDHSLETRYQAALALLVVADADQRYGDFDGYAASMQKAADTFKELSADQPNDLRFQRSWVEALYGIGEVLDLQGHQNEAFDQYADAMSIVMRWMDDDRQNDEALASFARISLKIGDIYTDQGKFEDAYKALGLSVGTFDRMSKKYPDNIKFKKYLAASYDRIGDWCVQQKKSEARFAYLEAYNILKRLTDADPTNIGLRFEFASTISMLADALPTTERADSISLHKLALGLHAKTLQGDASNALVLFSAAGEMLKLADLGDQPRDRFRTAAATLHALKAHGHLPPGLGLAVDNLVKRIGNAPAHGR